MSAENEDLHDLEKDLLALTPHPPRLSREQLFFQAGQVAAGHTIWPWRLATLIFGCLSLALALVWVFPPEPQPLVRYIVVPQTQQNPSSDLSPGPLEDLVQHAPGGEFSTYSLWKLQTSLRTGDDLAPLPPGRPLNEKGPPENHSILEYRRLIQGEL
jgi:hypothetical protein